MVILYKFMNLNVLKLIQKTMQPNNKVIYKSNLF
jgi:hypothetical protein